MITPIVLCGGSGTRLWPLSRSKHPKQFHSLVGTRTLLEETIERLKFVEGVQHTVAVCNQDFRFITAEQFRNCQVDAFSLLLEPFGRNTAPAIAAAAQWVLDNGHAPLLLVMPSDHVIRQPAEFAKAVASARYEAGQGSFVTFGIVPSSAEIGYGYIKAVSGSSGNLRPIERFVEKPDADTAQKFVDSGEYFWNSGMFLFHAEAYLDALSQYAPRIAEWAGRASKQSRSGFESVFLDEASFEQCPSGSIDYAVMEHTDKGVVVPLSAGWCDVGSWKGVWQVSDLDENDNIVRGDVKLKDVSNSCIVSDGRLVVVNKLDNIAVVDTKDVTYVAPIDSSQDIKQIVAELEREGRPEIEFHSRVFRPWGSFETIDTGEGFQVKRLILKPGAEISLQYHHHRSEHWVVVRGTAGVQKGDDVLQLEQNQSIYIPVGTTHKLSNPGPDTLEIIEVQTGEYLGEDDIVRLEDRYGRIEQA